MNFRHVEHYLFGPRLMFHLNKTRLGESNGRLRHVSTLIAREEGVRDTVTRFVELFRPTQMSEEEATADLLANRHLVNRQIYQFLTTNGKFKIIIFESIFMGVN